MNQSRCKNKTVDFFKKTYQGAREMFTSMHSPSSRCHHDYPVRSEPRIDFYVAFEEVDFVIAPELITLCNKLSTKIQNRSDAIQTSDGFISAVSCGETCDLTHPEAGKFNEEMTTSNNQYNRCCGLSSVTNADTTLTSEISSTSNIAYTNSNMAGVKSESPSNTDSDFVQNYRIPTCSSMTTLKQMSNESDFTSPKVKQRVTPHERIKSENGSTNSQSSDDERKKKKNITVKIIKMKGVEKQNKEDEGMGRAVPIFTIDTLGNSKIEIVSSQSSTRLEATLKNTNTNVLIKNKREFLSQAVNTSSTEVEDKDADKESTQDATKELKSSKGGTNIQEPLERFEMVTVDPTFSSITKFDSAGSMQITQRPVRGKTREKSENKFGLHQTDDRLSPRVFSIRALRPQSPGQSVRSSEHKSLSYNTSDTLHRLKRGKSMLPVPMKSHRSSYMKTIDRRESHALYSLTDTSPSTNPSLHTSKTVYLSRHKDHPSVIKRQISEAIPGRKPSIRHNDKTANMARGVNKSDVNKKDVNLLYKARIKKLDSVPKVKVDGVKKKQCDIKKSSIYLKRAHKKKPIENKSKLKLKKKGLYLRLDEPMNDNKAMKKRAEEILTLWKTETELRNRKSKHHSRKSEATLENQNEPAKVENQSEPCKIEIDEIGNRSPTPKSKQSEAQIIDSMEPDIKQSSYSTSTYCKDTESNIEREINNHPTP
ncbi:hypothetical protein M8J77_023645 [Diaphorina citri]|nr:hypothetical protein M8J77_023645 [Diaphorina citri]